MTAAVLPLHMGALHPFEQALTLLLAFGPFVVLGLVLRRRNKELRAEDESGRSTTGRTPHEPVDADEDATT